MCTCVRAHIYRPGKTAPSFYEGRLFLPTLVRCSDFAISLEYNPAAMGKEGGGGGPGPGNVEPPRRVLFRFEDDVVVCRVLFSDIPDYTRSIVRTRELSLFMRPERRCRRMDILVSVSYEDGFASMFVTKSWSLDILSPA